MRVSYNCCNSLEGQFLSVQIEANFAVWFSFQEFLFDNVLKYTRNLSPWETNTVYLRQCVAPSDATTFLRRPSEFQNQLLSLVPPILLTCATPVHQFHCRWNHVFFGRHRLQWNISNLFLPQVLLVAAVSFDIVNASSGIGLASVASMELAKSLTEVFNGSNCLGLLLVRSLGC